MIDKEITKLFKPYIVKRDKGQCQILIPLVELDKFVDSILNKVVVEVQSKFRREVIPSGSTRYSADVVELLNRLNSAYFMIPKEEWLVKERHNES